MARNKFIQGPYQVINKDKYIGKKEPFTRSSWEMTFCQFCDHNKHVLAWASEAIQVPYRHPLTGKQTVYVPDFLINYKDRHDIIRAELIEIKPKDQTLLTEKMKDRDRAVVAINYAKWQSAQAFCKRYGLFFRVITEYDLFHMGGVTPPNRKR